MRFACIGLFFISLLLGACGGGSQSTVVVIPAIKTSSGDVTEGQVSELPKTVAVLPFINRTKTDKAFEVVRRTMFNHFASKNYRALHWKDVDRRLKAADLYEADKMDAASVESLLSTLGVDGLLYGEITHYDKTFVGIYSQVAVGVRLRFVDRSGQEIWRGEDTVRSHAGGISTTPIGLILDAVAAAYHVKGDINLYRAADELGRDLMAKIPHPDVLGSHQPPAIAQVVHDGAGRILKYGDTLSIAMQGAPGKKAFVRIDGLKTIDMIEEQPGMYTAKYNVGPKDNLSGRAVVGVLSDDSGAQSEWISPIGLVDIDNLAPAAPTNIAVVSSDGSIQLSWTISDADVKSFVISSSEHVQGPYKEIATIADAHWSDGVENFTPHFYQVIAVDQVGHRSQPASITAQALPDSRLNDAKLLPTSLPAVIEGIAVMKANQGVYRINGVIELADGAVLFIEPGVRIEMAAKGKLKVFGELHAFGSNQKRIVISGAQGVNFATALELASEHAVVLRGVEIKGAGIALFITAGAPQILQSYILESQYNAMDISGVSKPRVEGTVIRGSQASAIMISGKAQPQFKGNKFSENSPFHMQSGSSYRIDARGNQWSPAASASTVLGDVDFSAGEEK